ncbi:MAG: (d)CMP kinase [Paenibacillaceae bacterium]
MNHIHRKIKVAIDGPAGAGKSSIAKMTAEKLGYVYVDTGAMYRAITWSVLDLNLDLNDTKGIQNMIEHIDLTLKPSHEGQQVWINGQDVTRHIRSPLINQNVSRIAQMPNVRQFLTEIQKRMSSEGGIIMDGRDIGTVVMPDAELKIFLTASVQERARRRYMEMKAAGNEVEMDQLIGEIIERDRMDEQREISPLRQAEDAIFLDCSELSMHQVIDILVELSISKMSEAE